MQIFVTPFEYIPPNQTNTRETAQALYLQGFELNDSVKVLHWNFSNTYSRTGIRAIEPSAFINLKNLQKFEGDASKESVYTIKEGMLYTCENQLVCCPQQRFKVGPLPNIGELNLTNLLAYSLFGVQFGTSGDTFLNKVFTDTTTIGDAAFSRSDIKHFEFGENLISLGDCAFAECGNLESVDAKGHSGLRKISDGAFMNCRQLKEVRIPEGVLCIEENAFNGCSSLTDVYLPSTFQCICKDAFLNCKNELKLHLPKDKNSKSIRLGMSECEYLAGEPDFSETESGAAGLYRNSYTLAKSLKPSSIGNVEFVEGA